MSTTAGKVAPLNKQKRNLYKHPKALLPLAFTEFWERFGFYIMQGLLILYMVKRFSFGDDKAYAILAEYTALAYIFPLLGGFIADKVLGFRYSVLLGAVLLGVGYACISTEVTFLFYLGLSFVVVGNGFLKPNISSFLGKFYPKKSPLRNGGFTFFYMGINGGIILSTLTAGYVQQVAGWMAAFSMAAVGMIIAIATFIYGMRYYQNKGYPIPAKNIKPKVLRMLSNKWVLLLIILVSVTVSLFSIQYAQVGQKILGGLGIAVFIGLIFLALRHRNLERRYLFALIVLIFISVFYWALFFEIYSSITLFLERVVNRNVFGSNIPPIMFLSLESIFILLLGPLFAKLWRILEEKGYAPSIGMKFALAFLAVAIAMELLVVGSAHPDANGLVLAIWPVLFYVFFTVGELLLSPTGLAIVTRLSPPKLVGMMMGVWFMALGLGASLSGYLAEQAAVAKSVTNINLIRAIYSQAFSHYTLYACILGVMTLIATPWLKKLTRKPV